MDDPALRRRVFALVDRYDSRHYGARVTITRHSTRSVVCDTEDTVVPLDTLLELPGVSRHSPGKWCVANDCLLAVCGVETHVDDVALTLPGNEPELWADLYPHQRDDVQFAANLRRCIIAHPCSGAKTLSGFAIAHELAQKTRCVLVVGPALSRGVWQTEHAKWLPNEGSFETITGMFPKKAEAVAALVPLQKRLLEQKHRDFPRFLFVNNEILASWADWLRQFKWDVVIMDEFHELRGRKSARVADGIRRVFVTNPQSARVGLTATPIWSRVDGLWTLLDLIAPGNFGTEFAFLTRYSGAMFDSVHQRVQKGALTNGDELRTRLSYWMRSVTPSNLPSLTRQLITTHSPASVKRLAAAVTWCAKNGVIDGSGIRRVLSAALHRETVVKLPALWEYVRLHEGRRLLVATQTKDSVAKIAESAPTGVTVITFTGEVSRDERMRLIHMAVNTPPPVVVCCTMQSIRQSIDASGLDGGVVLELPWTAEEIIQFEGRFRRSSRDEKNPVDMAYVVVDDSFDRRCIELLTQKLTERGQLLELTESDADLRSVITDEDGVDDVLRGMLVKLGL